MDTEKHDSTCGRLCGQPSGGPTATTWIWIWQRPQGPCAGAWPLALVGTRWGTHVGMPRSHECGEARPPARPHVHVHAPAPAGSCIHPDPSLQGSPGASRRRCGCLPGYQCPLRARTQIIVARTHRKGKVGSVRVEPASTVSCSHCQWRLAAYSPGTSVPCTAHRSEPHAFQDPTSRPPPPGGPAQRTHPGTNRVTRGGNGGLIA